MQERHHLRFVAVATAFRSFFSRLPAKPLVLVAFPEANTLLHVAVF